MAEYTMSIKRVGSGGGLRLISGVPLGLQIRTNTNMDLQLSTPQILQPTQSLSLSVQRRAASTDPSLPKDYIPSTTLSTSTSTPSAPAMTGPVRTAPRSRPSSAQPPRPPNAWILYRSDKARELSAADQKIQSKVSGAIAARWRAESPATRAEYERRAELKKAEHAIKYPNYRFQPKSKEEKERDRQIKKELKDQERLLNMQAKRANRDGTVAVAPIPSMGPTPNPPYTYPYGSIPIYTPDPRYGSAGPSPPLSAAASPAVASPRPESQHGDEQQGTSSHHASPYVTTQNNSLVNSPSTTLQTLYDTSTANLQQNSVLSVAPSLPQPGNSQWQPNQLAYESPAPSNAMSEWQNTTPSSLMIPTPDDYLSFNLQSFTGSSWEQTAQAMMSATGDPNVFEVNSIDANALLSHIAEGIEVSMGQQPVALTFDADFMSAFNYNFENYSTPSQALETPPDSLDTNHQFAELASFFAAHPGETVNYNEFINFDASVASAPAITNEHSQSVQPVANDELVVQQPTPYVPPTGAAYSSTRRVAGSWKPSFMTSDSPLDVSPPRSYGVHAT